MLLGDIGEHVDRVGGHNVDAVEAVGHDVFVDGFEDGGVAGDQVDARLAVALGHACAVDHERGVPAILVCAHRDVHVLAGERDGVVEVLHLGPDKILVEVDDGQVVGQTLVEKGVCVGGADSAGADENNLVTLSHGHVCKCGRQVAIVRGGVRRKR